MDDDFYLCKAYQIDVDEIRNGYPRFGGGELAWVYHLDPDLEIPV